MANENKLLLKSVLYSSWNHLIHHKGNIFGYLCSCGDALGPPAYREHVAVLPRRPGRRQRDHDRQQNETGGEHGHHVPEIPFGQLGLFADVVTITLPFTLFARRFRFVLHAGIHFGRRLDAVRFWRLVVRHGS